MNNKNIRQGRKAKRNGKVFEQYVERSCIRYRRKGIADIKKTPEPMRPVGVLDQRRGIFKAVYEKKGQPDFLGTLRGGRSVMIEAKHTDAKRIAFNRILSQQETDLINTMDLGGLALILISFELKRFYCIEWFDWQYMKENIGKKSVNDKDLAPYEVKLENGCINFLRGVL